MALLYDETQIKILFADAHDHVYASNSACIHTIHACIYIYIYTHISTCIHIHAFVAYLGQE